MRIPEDDMSRFEELDEQRRRIADDFNVIIGRIRAGEVRDDERLRIETQHLHTRHEGIIREMIDMLRY